MSQNITVEASQLPKPGSGIELSAGAREIALFCIGGNYYAVDNICSHAGAPICNGWIDGNEITCPWHGWAFDVTNGACLTVPGWDLQSYPVRIEEGKAIIQVDG